MQSNTYLDPLILIPDLHKPLSSISFFFYRNLLDRDTFSKSDPRKCYHILRAFYHANETQISLNCQENSWVKISMHLSHDNFFLLRLWRIDTSSWHPSLLSLSLSLTVIPFTLLFQSVPSIAAYHLHSNVTVRATESSLMHAAYKRQPSEY